jgi:hypothetical protein
MQYRVTYYNQQYYDKFGTMARQMATFVHANSPKEAKDVARVKLGDGFRIHMAKRFKGL